MWDESAAFSKRVHTVESQIRGLKKAADALIGTSEKVLSNPLPQDYALSESGSVHPVPGTGQQLTSANRLPRTKSAELQASVLDPIASWQADHTRLKGRMTELDKASLRLDEARRRHYKEAEKHLKDNVMKQDNVSAQHRREAEDPQLTGAREAFSKLEAEVHDELLRHGQNARSVQQYITRAMELQAARLQEVAKVHAQPFSGGTGALPTGSGAPAGGPVATLTPVSGVAPPHSGATPARAGAI